MLNLKAIGGSPLQIIHPFSQVPSDPQGDLLPASDGWFYGAAHNCIYKVSTNGAITTVFTFSDDGTNGFLPLGPLTQGSDGMLYGTTEFGPTIYTSNYNYYGSGTVFKISPNGQLTTLARFNTTNGENPAGGVIFGSDGLLYGATAFGGANERGTLFRVETSGSITVLHDFNLVDGLHVDSPLAFGNNGALYGVSAFGGSDGSGNVFKCTTNGVFTNLFDFTGSQASSPCGHLAKGDDGSLYGATQNGNAIFKIATNDTVSIISRISDGSVCGLIRGPDGNFYGMSETGGGLGEGAIFKVTPNGTESRLADVYFFYRGYRSGPIYDGDSAGLFFANDGTLYGFMTGGIIFKVANDGEFEVILDFTSLPSAFPEAGLIADNEGRLYGSLSEGVGANYGQVFQITTNGVFTTLAILQNINGAEPLGRLAIGPDSLLYGTTLQGANDANPEASGTVFRLSTNGALDSLFFFNGTNGANPVAGLTPGTNGLFYGSTSAGGSNEDGTLFEITTNGSLTTLVHFNGHNGSSPYGSLTSDQRGNFYGTTYLGGDFGLGTIFKLGVDGTFSTLLSFDGTNGANPFAELLLHTDGFLYGTTYSNSSNGDGTIFRATTNGTLTTLHVFNGLDGANPETKLLACEDGLLYGTTLNGGTLSSGTIFGVTTNGSFTSLVSIDPVHDGSNARGDLARGSDGFIYGASLNGPGDVYRIKPPPSFSAGFDGSNYLLTVRGLTNFHYRIECSDDLSALGNWNILTNFDVNSNPFTYRELVLQSNSQRYYRCVTE